MGGRERVSLLECCCAASGASSEIFSGDRRLSCNSALPTNVYQGIARPTPGQNPINPGTTNLYPPAPLNQFDSAKGCEVSERELLWTESEAGAGWQVRTLAGHPGYVRSVAISADGKRVVSGSWDATVKIWDVETGAEVSG